jgi:hypothetical protein
MSSTGTFISVAEDQEGKLPRIVTETDGLPVIMTDRSGRSSRVSMSGESVVGFKSDDISINYQYGISTVDIVDGGIVTGTGAVGKTGAMAYVEVGTGVGSALLESVDSIRYRAGHTCYADPSVVLPEPEAGVNIYIGFLNGADGWAWGYQGLELGIWFIEGGNTNFIPRSKWDDPLDGTGTSGYVLNPQGPQIPDLEFVWHGFKDLYLGFDIGNGTIIDAHKIRTMNTDAVETHLENPSLPVALKIERTAGTGSNLRVLTGSWRAGVITGVEENNSSNRWFGGFVLDRSNDVNNQVHVLAVRSKATYQGKTNHIKAEVKVLVAVNDTTKSIVFRATQLAALDPADQAAIVAGFDDIDTANSVLEISKASFSLTTPITDAQTGDVAVVQRGSNRDNTNVEGFNLYPNDDVVFIADGAGNGDFSFQLNVKELH